MNSSKFRLLVKICLLFIVYFATAWIGLQFDAVNKFATLVWMPSGISLAVLLLFGIDLWPGIMLGAFFINYHAGGPLLVAFGISIGNTLEAVVAYNLLRYFLFDNSLQHLRDVLVLLFLAAPIGTVISATIGVSSMIAGQIMPMTHFFETWRAWWLGDMISIIVGTPFVLTWSDKSTMNFQPSRVFEAAIVIFLNGLIGLVVFGQIFHVFPKGSPDTYYMFLPLIWASLRFGPRGASATVIALALLTLITTTLGLGPFTAGVLHSRLIALQSFMGVIAVSSLVLASADSERRALERRKDDFISLASHELKTPLTIIKTFTQLLQKNAAKEGNDKSGQYLQKMDLQINKLTVLINELLDISKINAGKLEFHYDYFSLPTLINEVVEDIQSTVASHKIIMKDTLKKEFIVYADKERITQVLINLLTNAIKYSPNGKKIIVRLIDSKETIVVSVRDYGIGIDKKHLRKLFQRYYRIDDTHNRTFPGLGIGLYISREIISRNDGKMWIESTEGKGSVFYFSLPIVTKKNYKMNSS